MALTGLGSLLLTQVSVGGSYLGDPPRPPAARPGDRRRVRRRLDRVADGVAESEAGLLLGVAAATALLGRRRAPEAAADTPAAA